MSGHLARTGGQAEAALQPLRRARLDIARAIVAVSLQQLSGLGLNKRHIGTIPTTPLSPDLAFSISANHCTPYALEGGTSNSMNLYFAL
jgi:hypothetical protein